MPHTATIALTASLLLASVMRAQDKTAAVDKIFAFATPDTPGCAVGVSQHGTVIVNKAYGLADVDKRVALRSSSIFDIGSTQKQFTAAAILLLAQDGRLKLDDDIRKYLPELPAYGHTIIVDNLITHTSGVRDWTALLPLAEPGIDVVKLVLRQRGLNTVPGEAWAYSSSGFELAKEIVARVSGMSFGDFVQRRFFQPLGMTSTSYVPDILQGSGERAMGYQKDGASWKAYMRLGNNRGGGALITTTGDLLAWNDAITNKRLGTLVAQKFEEPMRLTNGRTLGYARGLALDSIPGGRLVSHSGSAAGYSSWLGRFTDHDLSVAVMCNFAPVSATQLAARVADVFLPPVDPQAAPQGPAEAPGVEVSRRAGTFFDAHTNDPLVLIANNGRLGIAGGGPLIPVSADRFRVRRPTLFVRSQDNFEITFRSDDEFEYKSMEGKVTHYRRAQPWKPTPDEAKAFDGRYGSDELGTVFEVLPGTKGLLFRFERAPERVVEAEAVSRDTYMRELVVLRFLRDASGRITGLDYSSPVAKHIQFARLGGRRSDSRAPAATPGTAPAAADTTAPPLENLVGEYEMAPGRTLVITLEDGKLHGAPAGNPKRTLAHVTGATFSVEGTDRPMTLTFTLDATGKATAMVMRQNGNERTLNRVK